ncbi:MAG: GFA family protein [Betaproteobacteria bacterium]
MPLGAPHLRGGREPARVVVCHCDDCRILSGAPLRALVVVPVDRFHLVGEPTRYVKVAQSGNRRIQAFCPECGTPLFSAAEENPTSVNIRLGCICQRAALTPSIQIRTRSSMPWLHALASIPGSAGQEIFAHPPVVHRT